MGRGCLVGVGDGLGEGFVGVGEGDGLGDLLPIGDGVGEAGEGDVVVPGLAVVTGDAVTAGELVGVADLWKGVGGVNAISALCW